MTRMPENGRVRGSKRMLVLIRDKLRCRYCGVKLTKPQVDHILPRSAGGSHDLVNLAASCNQCNATKIGDVNPYLIEWTIDAHAGVDEADAQFSRYLIRAFTRTKDRVRAINEWLNAKE